MSIHIEDLTVRFKNGVTAINHANLNIPNGIFGLLGENGAGKTTLMRVLTTALKPTSGTVTLDRILYSEGNYEKIQRKIGYLPQEIDATHIRRQLPIPIHILRKSIDNVLANIPQKKRVTTIAPKQVIN